MISAGFWARGAALTWMVACGATASSTADLDDAGAAAERDAAVDPARDAEAPGAEAGTSSGGTSSSGGDPGDAATDGGTEGPSGDDGGVLEPRGPVQCGIQMPFGAPEPPPLPAYAGTCPALAAYPAYTEIVSGGVTRRFLVLRPSTEVAGEKLPLVFAWHWLGGDPEGMIQRMGLVAAVEHHRFIAVVPEPKDNETFRWPFSIASGSARLAEELSFFDDMLSCVGQAASVDNACVSSVGISAGALFTAQLVVGRSQRLSSFVSLSGGTDGSLVRPWSTAAHKVPGIVLWGGEGDVYPEQLPIMRFARLSRNLENHMVEENMGLVECVHDCGHEVPPFETPPSGIRYEAVFDFMLRHPYGLADGALEYPQGLPASFPSWCAVGRGNAVPRVGACN